MEHDDGPQSAERDDLPALGPTSRERILDVVAALGNMVPLVGGAVSQVLSGLSADLRMDRIEQVLQYLVDRLEGKTAPVNPFLESHEFSDLLEQILGQAAFESNEEKRNLYGKLLLGFIEEPPGSYDQRRRYLKTLEELQPAQVVVLKEIVAQENLGPLTQSSVADLRRQQDERAAFINPNMNAIEHLESMGLVSFRGQEATRRLPDPQGDFGESPTFRD